MTIWFTSDLHINHSNIIKYCKRPYRCVVEMNEALIKNHNALVQPNDTIYNLGDFAMNGNYGYLSSQMSRFNGKKHYILGNHDKPKIFEDMVVNGVLESCNQTLGVSINGQYIWLSHYAHRVWNKSHHNSWHCYAHSHGGLPSYGLSYDVGVDNNGYCPISFDQLSKIMGGLKEKLEDKSNALEYGVYQ
jgi:calcineurin-like phosphoesterase family protein